MFQDEEKAIIIEYDKDIHIRPGAGVHSRPFFWNGRAYFGAFDKKIYCIDSSSGELVWSFLTNDIVCTFPIAADGILYAPSFDGYCYALDAETGELIWKFRTGGRIFSPPAVIDDKVFFGSNDRYFYCIDKDGKLVWKFLTGNTNVAGCAVVNGSVLFASYDHHFYSLDKETGRLDWKFRTGGHVTGSIPTAVDDKFNVLWDNDHRLAAGKAKEGLIFAGSSDRHLYAVTLDGQLKWRFLTGSWPAGDARVFNKRIYFSCYDKHIYCLGADGIFKWRYVTGNGTESTPLIYNNTLYAGSLDTNLYALTLDGLFLWRFKTNGGMNASPAVHDNKIYFGSLDGNMYCLSPTGEMLWKFMTGFGEIAIISDRTKEQLNKLEKAPIMTFFKPETTAHQLQTAQQGYSIKTDPVFLQEAAGLYRSQPAYRAQSPYLEKKKDGYSR